jgi:Skp family chaperone for outer membrane proteins
MSLRPRLCALAAMLLTLVLGAGAARAESHVLEQAPASFRSWVESLPEAQQQAALRRLDEMPDRRRTRLFQRWDALDESQRRTLEQRMLERLERGDSARSQAGGERAEQRLQQMSPESKEKLAPLVRRWRDMGPLERRRMRQRLERFRMLAPEDQQALIDKRFAERSPEERARILESLREASKALPEHPLLDAPEAPPAPAPD